MTQIRKNEREKGLTADEIADWLRDNPEFLTQNPDLLDGLPAPARELGGGVSDLQQALIEKLRGDLELSRQRQRDLIATSRANLSSQTRIHECIVTMLAATSF
ncbi:MAG: DUF484 family protein, partial [Alphaproteobacteria bacterium]|nr:DUF484 family protein [Alphaproteobacteria bacterium]